MFDFEREKVMIKNQLNMFDEKLSSIVKCDESESGNRVACVPVVHPNSINAASGTIFSAAMFLAFASAYFICNRF